MTEAEKLERDNARFGYNPTNFQQPRSTRASTVAAQKHRAAQQLQQQLKINPNKRANTTYPHPEEPPDKWGCEDEETRVEPPAEEPQGREPPQEEDSDVEFHSLFEGADDRDDMSFQ